MAGIQSVVQQFKNAVRQEPEYQIKTRVAKQARNTASAQHKSKMSELTGTQEKISKENMNQPRIMTQDKFSKTNSLGI